MNIPAWILDIFAAVMLLVAAVSAGQLVVARAWTRAGVRDADIAGSHLLMGIAMAGTLVASLSTLPNAAWEVIFAVMTAWFAWCLWRETRGHGIAALASGHHAPHLIHSAAMLYMFAALTGPASGGSSGMAGSAGGMQSLQAPTLALVFALLLIAYSVRDLDRKAGADGYFRVVGRPSRRPGPHWPPRPRVRRLAVRRPRQPVVATVPSRPWRLPRPPRRRCRRATRRPSRSRPARPSGCCFLPPWSRAAGSRWASPWRSCC